MRAFDYFAPESVPGALEILSRRAGEAAVLAGGTDLLLRMKSGELSPPGVISLHRISEFREIDFSPETGLRLGACVTLHQLTRSPVIRGHYPCLAQTAGLMASEQVRTRATVGGNLCNAAPSADLAPPLLALSAEASIIGPGGERRVPLEDFFVGPGETCLQAGELLRAVLVPPPHGQTIYLKLAPRAYMDIAVVGVAVSLKKPDGNAPDVRIALGAVAPRPMRARRAEADLARRDLQSKHIETASILAAEECSPIDDVRATAWYRRRMVEVLVRRACLSLIEQRPGEMQP